MEPERQPGDDRIVWKVRPARSGGWAVVESGADVIDMIDDDEAGNVYEVQQAILTAEEWNALPEFTGW